MATDDYGNWHRCSPNMSGTADWMLVNGRVRTFDGVGTVCDALAVRGGRIAAAGPRDKVEALRTERTRMTDLGGASVLPGFCDTHMHFQKIARELTMVRLEHARSVRDVLSAFSEAAELAPEGEWIRSYGDTEAWHESRLDEGRLPSRAELDAAVPTHPVFVYRRPDAAALNSPAVDRVRTRLDAAEDGAWDEEAGLLRGAAVRALGDFLHREGAPSRERELDLLGAASLTLLAMGITSIVDPGLAAGFADSWELYRQARAQGRVAQRIHLMNRIDYRRPLAEELERFLSSPARPFEGDEFLRPWALKIFLDGEFHNAWMRPDEVGGVTPEQRYDVGEVEDVVDMCAVHGWPLCMHVMGGEAIGLAIGAVATARARGRRLFPGQISLAHAFLARADDLRACRALGIAISVQPVLGYVHDTEMATAWGEEVAGRANPLATMFAENVLVAGGSDTLPCEPLVGASVAVTRRSWNGAVRGPDQALTPAQALALFTRAGGEHLCLPDQGSLAPGQVADFVVWPTDVLEVNPERWPELRPQLAVVAGRVQWSNGDIAGATPA